MIYYFFKLIPKAKLWLVKFSQTRIILVKSLATKIFLKQNHKLEFDSKAKPSLYLFVSTISNSFREPNGRNIQLIDDHTVR